MSLQFLEKLVFVLNVQKLSSIFSIQNLFYLQYMRLAIICRG